MPSPSSSLPPATASPDASKIIEVGTSGLNIDLAVQQLIAGAPTDVPQYHCWRSVREAIEAGGVTLRTRPREAKNGGPALLEVGFVAVRADGYKEKKGDVAVIQDYEGGHVEGHACMYSGSQWLSDFKQRDMWSGPGYRSYKPSYTIYRP